MQHTGDSPIPTNVEVAPARCPVDHQALSQLSRQKTAHDIEPTGIPIEQDATGVWHIRNFEIARVVLRSASTKQAGFNAESMSNMRQITNQPILYLDGPKHHLQRKQTARFFTPKAVSENYRQLMENLSDELVGQLKRTKQADLCQLSHMLAVNVTSKVVGLTNSYPGLSGRLKAFFAFDEHPRSNTRLYRTFKLVQARTRALAFFALDVLPAVRARKSKPQSDVISHLIAQQYSEAEILTECITYAAAGMATTQEFIVIAAWHFLEHPELRQLYMLAPEEERIALLHEVLRLEPVVGHLYRRATADIEVESAGSHIVIAQGDLIDLHIYATNADEAIVDEPQLALCPGRAMKNDSILPMLMSFGDGVHRCPGAFLAMQETDIFLQRLLAIENLHIKSQPGVLWSPIVSGYELHHFMLTVQ